MALNAKQALFIEHYLRTDNATQSAIAAGYSAKTAYSIGSRLLKNVEISTRIRERVAEALKERQMGADEVLARTADIARADIRVFMRRLDNGTYVFDLSPNAPTQLIKSLKTRTRSLGGIETETETEVTLYDAQNALVTLGKHMKLWDRSLEDDDHELEKMLAELGLSADEVFDEAIKIVQKRREEAAE